MKREIAILLLALMLSTMLVSSCGQSSERLATLPAGSTTPVPSLTPLPVDTSTPALIPTVILALPIEEAQTRLLQLLSNNGNCRLPCLWGITPGVSTNEEAQAILVPISSIADLSIFRPEGGGIVPRYSEGGLEIYTSSSFIADLNSGVVNRLAFNVEAHRPLDEGGYEDVFDSQFFGKKVGAYSLSYVLTEQGIPSAVLISTMAGPPTRGGKAGFYMVLLYPDQGILVSYTTNWQNRSGNALGCFQNAHVEMELYPSGQGDSFSEFLAPTKWSGMWPVPVESPYWKPIEKATAMSLEQFYEIFRQPTDQCIETPVNIWPTPEP